MKNSDKLSGQIFEGIPGNLGENPGGIWSIKISSRLPGAIPWETSGVIYLWTPGRATEKIPENIYWRIPGQTVEVTLYEIFGIIPGETRRIILGAINEESVHERTPDLNYFFMIIFIPLKAWSNSWNNSQSYCSGNSWMSSWNL